MLSIGLPIMEAFDMMQQKTLFYIVNCPGASHLLQFDSSGCIWAMGLLNKKWPCYGHLSHTQQAALKGATEIA